MYGLSDIIQEYINKKIKSQKEKEIVIKLLLDDFKICLEEENEKKRKVPFSISLKSLQTGRYNLEIADAFHLLLSRSTRTKENTRKRIVAFIKYLYDEHNIKIILYEEFEREAMDSFERKIDLLKTLNENKTKAELMEHYNIGSNPLLKDINELIDGTTLLGQKVKIRDIQKEKGKIIYQSTIHPIFMPLNLTEVYFLIVGLKSLSKEHESFSSRIYDNLANRIYSQLSEYARKKIYSKCKQMGMSFPYDDELEEFSESMDEEKMAKIVDNTLAYLWKAGAKCNIYMKNDDKTIYNCYIEYNISTKDIYIKDSITGEGKKKIDVSNILNIEFDYV